MSPGEREFGELIGKVDGISVQINDLQRSNSAEHQANAIRLKGIEERLDSLEATRDRQSGGKAILTGVAGAVLTLLGILIGHH